MAGVRLHSIQYLRGVASVVVLVGHAYNTVDPHWTLLSRGFLQVTFMRGATGVGLFFVISGFVMVHSAVLDRARPERSLVFLVRRFGRILPLFWIVNIAILFFLYRDDIWRFLFCMFLLPTNVQGHAPEYGTAMNYVPWSLTYEVYFYVVFGVALLFGRAAIACILCYFFVTLVCIPLWCASELHYEPTHSYGFSNCGLAIATNPIIWHFCLGMCAAYLFQLFRWRVCRKVWALLSLVAICVFVVCVVTSPSLCSPIFIGVPSAALVLTLAAYEWRGGAFDRKVFIYLGTISYALYLVHPVVLDVLKRLAPPPVAGQEHVLFSGLILLTAVSIVCGHLLHRYVETPIGRAIRSFQDAIFDRSIEVRASGGCSDQTVA